MKVIVPMAEVVKEDSQEPKKKSVFAKIKEKAGDSEEHLAILQTLWLGVLIWSGGILTLELRNHSRPGPTKNRSNFHCQRVYGVLLLMAYKQQKIW